MFGKRRSFIIMYFLAAAVLLLTLTGDGPDALRRFSGVHSERVTVSEPEITITRSEIALMEGSSWETILYKISSPVEGPTVMVIGGIHGDEPAGYMAADEIASWVVDRGTLLVLPRANVPAIEKRTRNAPGEPDLNRVFPGDSNGGPAEEMGAVIMELIIEYEPTWVIDLHEAEYCERLIPGALGQTFLYPRKADSLDIVEELLTAVNRSIYNEKKHFLLLRGVARGSAAKGALMAGAEGIIIETCEQMQIEERIQYHCQVVSAMLYTLGITVY